MESSIKLEFNNKQHCQLHRESKRVITRAFKLRKTSMVVYEEIGNNTVKAYSSEGKMIRGGFPEGMYAEAYDPAGANRKYEETDEYIPT